MYTICRSNTCCWHCWATLNNGDKRAVQYSNKRTRTTHCILTHVIRLYGSRINKDHGYGSQDKNVSVTVWQTMRITSTDKNFHFPVAHTLSPVNFALNKPVWTTDDDRVNPPSNAVDGNPSTFAAVDAPRFDWPFLAIDLEARITLVTVMVNLRRGESYI